MDQGTEAKIYGRSGRKPALQDQIIKDIKTFTVISALIVLGCGCSLFEGNGHEEPLARVFEQHLYPSDINHAIPAGTSVQDSIVLARRYVDTWVKNQLMLNRAEQALTEEQKDFENQIAEYRWSLLIYSYRQKLLQQKLDTVVSDTEVQSYYDANINNFILGQNVIKGTFVKVPLSAPRIDELRGWSRTNGEDDLDQIEKYCISYADKYSDFNDTWVYFTSIKAQLPMKISQPARYLRFNKNIETTDSLYRYFLHVDDHLPDGEVTPIEMVNADITNIIMNKRKIEFFQDLEQRVYNDGVSRNQFEIYR